MTKLLPHNFKNRLKIFLEKLPRDSWLPVILSFKGIIAHERYQKVSSLLLKNNCRTVLDVGSGGYSQINGFKSISVDIKPKKGVLVVASALNLPFNNKVFDCVTAVDVLEHIASSERNRAINEMKRCGRTVIIHTPLQDGKLFMGREGDIIFLNYLKTSTNRLDENTMEHIDCCEPKLNELTKHSIGYLQPDWNLNIWLTLMKCRYRFYNLTAPLLTILYRILLCRIQNPPYYGAYILFDCRKDSY